jgi:hypothetical protein
MALLTAAAVIVSISAGAMIVYYLIDVIQALRSISAKLANARILLLTVASQTEPAGDLVRGVGSNVTALHELVTGVARSLGLPEAGVR